MHRPLVFSTRASIASCAASSSAVAAITTSGAPGLTGVRAPARSIDSPATLR
jgi:hypothetical protein